jgi:hypothetical protein
MRGVYVVGKIWNEILVEISNAFAVGSVQELRKISPFWFLLFTKVAQYRYDMRWYKII